jgi:hypothetical protein
MEKCGSGIRDYIPDPQHWFSQTLTLENQIFLANILLYFSRAYTDRQPDLTAELAGQTLRLFPASCRVAELDPDQKTISIGRMGAPVCDVHCTYFFPT